ncbi:hypothetical protein KYI11_12555 (plasmid) [Macrococcoides bohemicum]|uniref:Uncharacterized protein n=1 Tax=Macrococcoides bohemicum TaxID=1903056 RepID=A0AAJ4PCV1_9STAP|nr:hypothetical protein [Macrococcus bohemicus]QYA43650.1 hypothetical protein KYI11_12555 [Macrococcus bohemicus]
MRTTYKHRYSFAVTSDNMHHIRIHHVINSSYNDIHRSHDTYVYTSIHVIERHTSDVRHRITLKVLQSI